jgi:hypothetical protein
MNGKKSQRLMLLAGIVAAFALAPLSSASARTIPPPGFTRTISPPGSVRNVPLRDSCGGANVNVNWSSDATSAWGEVWDNPNCKSYQYFILNYGNGNYSEQWTTPGAAAGETIGFNSGTLSMPYLDDEWGYVCDPTSCSAPYQFVGG